MKKLLFLCINALLILSFAACGEGAPVASDPPGAPSDQISQAPATKAPAAPGFSASDIALVIDGDTYVCDVPVDMLIATFGEGYTYSESISCAYDGMDKVFEYDTFAVYTYPQGASDYILEIYAESSGVATTKGITPGASSADVIAAYGEGFTMEGIIMRYEIPSGSSDVAGAALEFEMDGDTVRAIGILAEQVLAEG